MIRKTLVGLAVVAFTWLAANTTLAATVPTGSTLIVRTLDTIRSVDTPGTRFTAQLQNNVGAGGKVGLKAGTTVSGKVVTSRRLVSSTQRLTVDITEINLNGKKVPIKTTGPVTLDNNNFKTRNDRSVSRAGYAVSPGRVIQFQLAHPLHF